jgi:hypothetical protein
MKENAHCICAYEKSSMSASTFDVRDLLTHSERIQFKIFVNLGILKRQGFKLPENLRLSKMQ